MSWLTLVGPSRRGDPAIKRRRRRRPNEVATSTHTHRTLRRRRRRRECVAEKRLLLRVVCGVCAGPKA